MAKKLNVIALLLLSLLISACAPKDKAGSGFLGDAAVYSGLKPHPELDGLMVYRTSEHPLAEYELFIIPPVKIYLNAAGRKRELEEEDLAELAKTFHNEVLEAVDKDFQITNIPGPRTAIIRLALTDADPNIQLLNVHPGAVLTGAGLGGATAEYELVDSESGLVIAAGVASSKGKRYEYHRGLSKWGHTEGVFKEWAGMIRDRIREDHNINVGQG